MKCTVIQLQSGTELADYKLCMDIFPPLPRSREKAMTFCHLVVFGFRTSVQFSKILFVYDMLELDVCTKKEAKRRKVEE